MLILNTEIPRKTLFITTAVAWFEEG